MLTMKILAAEPKVTRMQFWCAVNDATTSAVELQAKK